MPTTFPENEVEVLQRYLPDELHTALQRARAELTKTIADGLVDPATLKELGGAIDASQELQQQRAFEINEARKRFLALLDKASLGHQEKPGPIVALDEITDNVMRHELPGAIDRLKSFDRNTAPLDLPPLGRDAFATAFTASPSAFWASRVTKVIHTPHGDHEIVVTNEHSLPGYDSSARLAPAAIDLLLVLLSFLSKTSERTFRLGVLRGEVQFALGAYEEAIREYGTLLPGAPPEVLTPPVEVPTHTVVGPIHEVGAPAASDTELRTSLLSAEVLASIVGSLPTLETVDVGTAEPITPRQQFVALRSGFAELGLGDALFRKSGGPDESGRAHITASYNAAVSMAASNAISPENPRRRQIEQYAAMQQAKLDAGLNFLGYRDSYAPILRPATLQALAERRIQAAAEAVQKFEFFKSKADQIQDQLRELDFQRDVKAIELAIADEQIAKVNDQVAIASTQIEKISAQLDGLDTSSLVDIGGALLQGAAFAVLAGSTGGAGGAFAGSIIGSNVPGVVGALSGGASTLASYSARKNDLQFQKRIAEKEQDIGRRDVAIAKLGKQIAETTVDFLDERVRRIQNRELNPDLYYAAGEAFRALAVRHLDAAILWSYLFERAVSFLRVEPDLRTIRLDYASGPGALLTAPERLRSDLNDVVDLNIPITKFQLLTETYSLRSLFPLEFNRFLQTGRMDFAMSLYELNKRRPGVYRQRIKRVHVELQFPPPSGFTGRIRHRGSFVLRDKDTTPEPGSGTFIPTGDQLEAAFAALGSGATQGVSMGGVMPFLLDIDTLELSLDQPPFDLGDPAPEALAPIEGYGPAGDWTLEVENVDLRFITDALLRITYVIPESDEPLSIRVRGLIAAYEQELLQGDALDLISPFSLRQRFPDTLDRLAGGEGQLAMVRDDFPAGIGGLKLKTIVVQALDANRKGLEGVALEISKPGTAFLIQRSTRADGFSEDLTAQIPVLPPDQRVDLEGTYALHLPNPAQLGAVKDVLVFFNYQFREV
jgi:hypothetical protein